jgi:hypothetical protein
MQVFSTIPSLHPSSVQIFSSTPCSQTPSVYVPLYECIKYKTQIRELQTRYCTYKFFSVWMMAPAPVRQFQEVIRFLPRLGTDNSFLGTNGYVCRSAASVLDRHVLIRGYMGEQHLLVGCGTRKWVSNGTSYSLHHTRTICHTWILLLCVSTALLKGEAAWNWNRRNSRRMKKIAQ